MSSTLPLNQALKPYSYEPLISDDSMRVVVLCPAATKDAPLRCSIIQYERSVELGGVDNSRHYSAVSYAWGEPNFTELLYVHPGVNAPIEGASSSCSATSETCLWITLNVDTLLRAFRKAHKPVYLWVDAICLNQNDDDEKAQQVPLMGEIYTMAKKVLIWLGNDDTDSRGASAFVLLRRLNLHYKTPDESEQHALTQLFERSWFTRRWVIQEVALARRRVLCWGQASIDLDWLMRILPNMTKGFAHDLYAPRLLQMVIGKSAGDYSLLSALWELDRSECSDPRDRIAALMGLVAPVQRFQVDYGTEDGWITYQRLVTHLVNRNPESAWVILIHLFDFGPADTNPSLTGHGVVCPSWVPDWSARRRSSLLPNYDKLTITVGNGGPHMGTNPESKPDETHEYDFVLRAKVRQLYQWDMQLRSMERELRPENTCQIWETMVHKMKSFLDTFELVGAPSRGQDARLRALFRAHCSQKVKLGRICTFLASQMGDPRKHDNYGTYRLRLGSELLERTMLEAFQKGMAQPDTLRPKYKKVLTELGLLLSHFSLIKWYFHWSSGKGDMHRSYGLALGPHNAKVNDLLLPLAWSNDESLGHAETMLCLRPTGSPEIVPTSAIDDKLDCSDCFFISEARIVGPAFFNGWDPALTSWDDHPIYEGDDSIPWDRMPIIVNIV
ncbi:hypothetical protein N0V82_005192 [Gnomoniopsis sp. IMI 355080]|nr:hypothetical protein N0V82_005192 [Gnomoniopsis sp. IMI 355080]